MIDHVGLNVRDLDAAKSFYARALAPLRYEVAVEIGEHVGFRDGDGREDFWLVRRPPVGGSTHVCFAAESRAVVDAFHAAALAAGGRDNGPPGLRPEYHERYYGGFVLDPDGNNVEAVAYTDS
ncbi:MAG TPA: VOC family protein [Gaiellaceae bacterium]|nr:VOC family protein [Gaiellaceae bacterium]